jgi:cephalosporin hydroxylase
MNGLTIEENKIIDDFHRLYYRKAYFDKKIDGSPIDSTTIKWQGIPIGKMPLDLWIYQELIWQTKPDVIIETGTWFGGSALFFADLCKLFGFGTVVTIDNSLTKRMIVGRDNLIYMLGNSVDIEVRDSVVQRAIKPGNRVMVILDSNHRKDHVLKELDLWAILVTKGCALIVEDTNINGNPVLEGFGPGPKEALDEWLPQHPEFKIDKQCEKLLVTFNSGGYLERV